MIFIFLKKYELINTNKIKLVVNKEIIKLILMSIKSESNKKVRNEIIIDKIVYFIAIRGSLDEL